MPKDADTTLDDAESWEDPEAVLEGSVESIDDGAMAGDSTSDDTSTTNTIEDDGHDEGTSPAGPPAAVVLRGASRWYGEVIGINDIDVRIAPGITGVLGPNGAGKSTLIKLLVGLMRPSSGHVMVLGEDPWDNPQLLGRIGYVPEAPAPWRDETGAMAVLRAARLSGLGSEQAEAASARALQQVGLSDVADREVGTYSRGMAQRLKFALAIVHEPELLVLDEPLLGTDPVARRDLLDLIRELGAKGVSILLSTHVLPDVEALTDRILVMNHGRLMAYGDVAEIRDLLDSYPRTVRIETTDARGLGKAVWGWPSVLSLEAGEDSLTVRTAEPAAFFASLQDLLAEGKHPFSSVSSPDDHVESVFRYLVG